jgi:probable rRNA maturation factor
MSSILDLQIASKSNNIPSMEQFQLWVNTALSEHHVASELTIRIVDEEESAMLNSKYRKKTGPTNVLSFPVDIDPPFDYPLLGDIVICAPVVSSQAQEYCKDLTAHWAHIVIHGTLHLLGYDHITQEEATKMETLETELLVNLGYPPPYGEQ